MQWTLTLLDRDGDEIAYPGYRPVTFEAAAITIDPVFVDLNAVIDFAPNDTGATVIATQARLTNVTTGHSVIFGITPPIRIANAAEGAEKYGHIGVKIEHGGVTPRVERIVVSTKDWEHLTGKPAI